MLFLLSGKYHQDISLSSQTGEEKRKEITKYPEFIQPLLYSRPAQGTATMESVTQNW
jgi:hypothetical protein